MVGQMNYVRGKDCRIFITTECTEAGVDLSASTPVASATAGGISTLTGVGKLGSVTTTGADGVDKLDDVTGVSYNAGSEDETKQVMDSAKDRDIPLRDVGDINITLISRSRNIMKLQRARFGVKDATTLHSGLEPYKAVLGYRVYLYFIKEDKTMVFYHCTIPGDGVKEDLDKVGAQTLKFKCNNFDLDVATADLSKAMELE